MKKGGLLLLLGMLALNAAFGCEGRTRGGKYDITFKDYPCCFVGINLAGAIDFTDCGKHSPEVLYEAKDIVKEMVKLKNRDKKKSKEYEALDAKLIDLTGRSYAEYQEMHYRSIDESGIKKLAK